MKLLTLHRIAQRHAVLVLFFLFVVSFLTGFHSYSATNERVATDMDHALMLAMSAQKDEVITADTIRLFNHFLETEELRGKATLIVGTRLAEDDRLMGSAAVSAHCSRATVLAMSDQRPALLLMSLTLLWAMFCWVVMARRRATGQLPQADLANSFGGMSYCDGAFYASATGEPVKLTPMQLQLMEMFFLSPSHSLSKHEICDALWPKKMDASETLYALIRRLRPIVEKHSDLRIESDRSKAYRLVAAASAE